MTSLVSQASAVPTASAAVEIAGSGLAELTCAWLLLARGHRVRLRSSGPAAGPRPLLLNELTLNLLHSLWGRAPLADCHYLTHRQACWGPGAGPIGRRLPQPATVVDGARLTERLLGRLAARYPDAFSGAARPTAVDRHGRWIVRSLDGRAAPPPGRGGPAGARHGRDHRSARLHRTGVAAPDPTGRWARPASKP